MAERRTASKKSSKPTSKPVAAPADSAEGPTEAMARADLRRMSPLDGRYATGPGVTLTPLSPRQRISLRLDAPSTKAVEAKLGLTLPRHPKTSASADGLSALWLGPDEWLVIADGAAPEPSTAAAALARVAGISAVDVSHRNVALAIEGPAAEAVIAAGCPQDIRLGSFPVGAAGRTVLAKAEIVLWRTGEQRFEIECWRSFGDYVWTFLAEAARSPAV